MTVTTTTTEALGLPPAPAPARRGTLLVATFLAITAGTVLIGGLLAAYFQAKDAVLAGGGEFAPAAPDLPNVALAVTYGALLLASFTGQWAVWAIRVGERRQTFVAVGVTLLLGVAFVNGLTFCFSQLGLVAGESTYANHVYAVAGTHLVLVVAALVYLVVMGFRVIGGQFGPGNSEFVVSAVAFLHFSVAAGAAVYWCLWFLPGGPSQ
jgi:heme/copper-type cytochrome/quinol oxidase subunit 3